MSAAGEGSTEPNLYFCPSGRNVNESVLPHHKNRYPYGWRFFVVEGSEANPFILHRWYKNTPPVLEWWGIFYSKITGTRFAKKIAHKNQNQNLEKILLFGLLKINRSESKIGMGMIRIM